MSLLNCQLWYYHKYYLLLLNLALDRLPIYLFFLNCVQEKITDICNHMKKFYLIWLWQLVSPMNTSKNATDVNFNFLKIQSILELSNVFFSQLTRFLWHNGLPLYTFAYKCGHVILKYHQSISLPGAITIRKVNINKSMCAC